MYMYKIIFFDFTGVPEGMMIISVMMSANSCKPTIHTRVSKTSTTHPNV